MATVNGNDKQRIELEDAVLQARNRVILLQWVSSARHIVETVKHIAERRPEFCATLQEYGLPFRLSWDHDEEAAAQAVFFDLDQRLAELPERAFPPGSQG